MSESWTGLRVVCCAAALVGAAYAQSVRPADPVTTRPSLDILVEQLGNHRYSVRSEATAQLSQLRPNDLAELVRRYRAEPRHERKLRLRYAIENVYYRKLMTGQVGFLGITPLPIIGVYDPKTGRTVECIIAVKVLEENAAHRAGLREKDVLLEFDGQPLAKLMSSAAPGQPGDGQPNGAPLVLRSAELEAFTSHVKMREPGSRIPLRVLRAGEPRKVRVPVGPRPDLMVDARTMAATALASGGSLAMGLAGGGLVITQVPERSWMTDAGLQVNDVVVAVDGQPIPSGGTMETLERAFMAGGPGRSVLLEVRRLEQVELTVTLGARPPDMMNLPDWDEAQKRFATWWQSEVGEPSIRIRPPRWTYFVSAAPATPVAPEPQLLP